MLAIEHVKQESSSGQGDVVRNNLSEVSGTIEVCEPTCMAFSFPGEVMLVAPRLDARYDWLPSPHNLIHKHTRFRIVYYGNACHFQTDWGKSSQNNDNKKTKKSQKIKPSEGRIALVSPGGDCSYFTKVTGL